MERAINSQSRGKSPEYLNTTSKLSIGDQNLLYFDMRGYAPPRNLSPCLTELFYRPIVIYSTVTYDN